LKIEEYLNTLPESILSGQDVQLSKQTFRDIFKFVNLGKNDVFYHLGCGNGLGLAIAKEEFNAKKIIGIDNSKEKIDAANKMLVEKDKSDVSIIHDDIVNVNIDDADVILFWFTDENILEKMMPKFSALKHGTKIITIWGPLPECLPHMVDFPYIINQVPFKKANDLKDQLLAIFDVKCIDFVTAWEFAERYTNAIGKDNPENDRFLTILQSLVIWINARNLGVACGDEIPESITTYMSILKNYFGIEIEHLIK
jgi:16S rRNA A1518/A1519 N6-dimethyltransferase RsmA/KsgA/DIM1 with predicted DNA glycosylase/AP lyase activity